MSDFENPYAATITSDSVESDGELEAIRRQYLTHEASIRSMGTLYLIGAAVAILVVSSSLATGVRLAAPNARIAMLLCVVLLGIGLAQGVTGLGLRKLQPWTRVAGSILAAIGLIGFPIGTLISAYFLYLLLSAKGAFVFSKEYHDIIEQTPHIRYKTSAIVWAFLILLLVVLTLGIGAILFARV